MHLPMSSSGRFSTSFGKDAVSKGRLHAKPSLPNNSKARGENSSCGQTDRAPSTGRRLCRRPAAARPKIETLRASQRTASYDPLRLVLAHTVAIRGRGAHRRVQIRCHRSLWSNPHSDRFRSRSTKPLCCYARFRVRGVTSLDGPSLRLSPHSCLPGREKKKPQGA